MPARCYDEGRAQEAAALLEKDRVPVRSDIELAIGRAYEVAGDKQKAVDAFRNLYFNLPNSFEADAAGAELRKLGISGSTHRAPHSRRSSCSRASTTATRPMTTAICCVNEAVPPERPEMQLALAAVARKERPQSRCSQLLTSHGRADRRRRSRTPLPAERDGALHQRRRCSPTKRSTSCASLARPVRGSNRRCFPPATCTC